jgi:hypothetical protein
VSEGAELHRFLLQGSVGKQVGHGPWKTPVFPDPAGGSTLWERFCGGLPQGRFEYKALGGMPPCRSPT